MVANLSFYMYVSIPLPRFRPAAGAPAIALALVLTLSSAPASAQASSASVAAADSAREALIARADRGRIRGREDALWVVVISDFQCPFCKRWHDETESRIEREYVRTGKVQIAYINLPIPSIHRNAPPAHDVAMCAAEQGKFWPMADALFATQSLWKERGNVSAYFDSLAGTLPIDRARLRACIRGGALRPLIEADIERATRMGVGSTPTFLIGGRPLIGAQPYEAFRSAIEAALTAAAAAPAKPVR